MQRLKPTSTPTLTLLSHWTLILLLCLSTPALAEVYKWIDSQGQVHFSDRPSQKHQSKSIQVKINSYTNSTVIKRDNNNKSLPVSTPSEKVVMYSTSWCGYCKKARNYFTANNIPFIDYDIETNSKGKRDYKKLNGAGVPIILFNEKRMNGFSEAGFKRIYQS